MVTVLLLPSLAKRWRDRVQRHPYRTVTLQKFTISRPDVLGSAVLVYCSVCRFNWRAFQPLPARVFTIAATLLLQLYLLAYFYFFVCTKNSVDLIWAVLKQYSALWLLKLYFVKLFLFLGWQGAFTDLIFVPIFVVENELLMILDVTRLITTVNFGSYSWGFHFLLHRRPHKNLQLILVTYPACFLVRTVELEASHISHFETKRGSPDCCVRQIKVPEQILGSSVRHECHLVFDFFYNHKHVSVPSTFFS